MSTQITIAGLVKEFPSASGVTRAVDGVDLTIEPGELFFLLGPSGCGKTTLLRMIAGFIDPTAGTIRFGNRDVTHTPANKRNTGMVFQSYALWPHMTVEANVAYGLKVRKISPDERKQRVREALAAVQMEPYAERKPTQLSGGQQQRVALARALVIRPEVLLLDEPLSNLDAKLRTDLRTEIRRICKESGITGVYVTHDQKEALSMADRLAIMQAGQVKQIGTPRDIYQTPNTKFVASFLGEVNFLSGKVLQRTPDTVRVGTAIGELEAKPAPGLDGHASCTVSFRPEHVELIPASDAAGTPATVAQAIYLGDHTSCELRLADGVSVHAMIAGVRASEVREGDHVGVRLAPRTAVALPAD